MNQTSKLNDDTKESLWLSSLIYGIGDLLTKSTRLLLIPFYVQVLTLSELGTIAVCQAVSAGVWALSRFGSGQYVQRFILSEEPVWNREPLAGHAFVSTVWWFRLMAGALLTGVLIAILYFQGASLFGDLPFWLLVMAVGTGNWRASLTVTEFGLIGQGRALAYRLLTFLVFLTSILLIIVLVVVFKLGLWGAVFAEFAALGAWVVATGIRHTWLARPNFTALNWKKLAAFSFPIMPHIVFMWGLMSADRLILSRLVDQDLIGVYDISYLLGSGVAVFGTALLLPWLPVFYKLTDNALAAEYFKKRALSQAVICLVMALSVNLFAFEISSIMAARYAVEATPLIQLILPATFLLMLNAIFVKPLIHQKKTSTVSFLSGTGFAVNIALNFLLIPWLGVTGSAIATIGAYGVMTVGSIVQSNRHLAVDWNLPPMPVARIAIISVLVYTAGIFLPLRLSTMNFSLKIALAAFCWLAIFLRLERNKRGRGVRISLCLSPLQN